MVRSLLRATPHPSGLKPNRTVFQHGFSCHRLSICLRKNSGACRDSGLPLMALLERKGHGNHAPRPLPAAQLCGCPQPGTPQGSTPAQQRGHDVLGAWVLALFLSAAAVEMQACLCLFLFCNENPSFRLHLGWACADQVSSVSDKAPKILFLLKPGTAKQPSPH